MKRHTTTTQCSPGASKRHKPADTTTSMSADAASGVMQFLCDHELAQTRRTSRAGVFAIAARDAWAQRDVALDNRRVLQSFLRNPPAVKQVLLAEEALYFSTTSQLADMCARLPDTTSLLLLFEPIVVWPGQQRRRALLGQDLAWLTTDPAESTDPKEQAITDLRLLNRARRVFGDDRVHTHPVHIADPECVGDICRYEDWLQYISCWGF